MMLTEVSLDNKTSLEPNVWIEIDLSKLHRNVEKIKKKLAPGKKVIAVVKANAYGHGLEGVVKSLQQEVDYFAVADISEANVIRELGVTTPILVMGVCFEGSLEWAILNHITLTVSSYEMAKQISEKAEILQKPAIVHIKVDTGMGRFGLPYRESFEKIQKIFSLPLLYMEGIYTHFTQADSQDSNYTDKQLDLFEVLLEELEKKGRVFDYIHTSNTAGVVTQINSSFVNAVRPGIALYGYMTNQRLSSPVSFEPVLSLKTRLVFDKVIEKGKGVSYGRSFVAAEKTRIGILPIGYSHGIPYSLSKKMQVLNVDKKYQIAGNICMDYTLIRLGLDAKVTVGDTFIILGDSGKESIWADDLAEKAGTLVYEILTGLHERVKRIYLNDVTGN